MESLREQILILVSTPVYLVIIGLELLLSHYRPGKGYSFKDTFTNVFLMLMNSVLDLLLRGFYLGVLAYCWQHRLIGIETAFIYWVLLVLIEDFMYYWLHRFDHEFVCSGRCMLRIILLTNSILLLVSVLLSFSLLSFYLFYSSGLCWVSSRSILLLFILPHRPGASLYIPSK